MSNLKRAVIGCAPHLPVCRGEIIAGDLLAAKAGATVLHVHARGPHAGRPDPFEASGLGSRGGSSPVSQDKEKKF